MNLEAFHSRYPEFPQLPEFLVRSRLLEVLQDLCAETWVYTEVITLLTTAGTREYTLAPSVSTDKVLGVLPDEVESATLDTPQPTATAATAGAGTLVNGTAYYYKVTATRDDYGETLPCAEVSATATATGTIELAWDAIDGADGYKIYRASASGGTFGYVEAATTNSYDDDGDETPDTDTTPPTVSVLMKEINPVTPSSRKAASSTWRHREGSSIQRVIDNGDGTIRVDPIPDTSGIGLQMRVALKPNSSAKTAALPSVLERHIDVVDEGVRWKLHLTPKTKGFTWSDPQLGAYHRHRYLAKRSGIKSNRMLGYGGTATMRPGRGSPWF